MNTQQVDNDGNVVKFKKRKFLSSSVQTHNGFVKRIKQFVLGVLWTSYIGNWVLIYNSYNQWEDWMTHTAYISIFLMAVSTAAVWKLDEIR